MADDYGFIERKIESVNNPAILSEEHFAEKTSEREFFCDSFKIDILLRRAVFKTTRRLASCHVKKWNEDEDFEDLEK